MAEVPGIYRFVTSREFAIFGQEMVPAGILLKVGNLGKMGFKLHLGMFFATEVQFFCPNKIPPPNITGQEPPIQDPHNRGLGIPPSKYDLLLGVFICTGIGGGFVCFLLRRFVCIFVPGRGRQTGGRV